MVTTATLNFNYKFADFHNLYSFLLFTRFMFTDKLRNGHIFAMRGAFLNTAK